MKTSWLVLLLVSCWAIAAYADDSDDVEVIDLDGQVPEPKLAPKAEPKKEEPKKKKAAEPESKATDADLEDGTVDPDNTDVEHPWSRKFTPPKEFVHAKFKLVLARAEHANKLHRAVKRNALHLNKTMGWAGLANRTLNFHKADIQHYVKQAESRSMYTYLIEATDGKVVNGLITFNRPDFLSDAKPVPIQPNQQWPAGPRSIDASFWTDKKQTEDHKLDSIVLKAVCDWMEDEWPIDIVMFSVKKYNKRQAKIMNAAKLKAFDPDLGEYAGMFDKSFWFLRTGFPDVDLVSLPLPIMGEDRAEVALREFRKIKGLTTEEKEQLAAYKRKYASEAFQQGFCKQDPCTDEEIKHWGRALSNEKVDELNANTKAEMNPELRKALEELERLQREQEEAEEREEAESVAQSEQAKPEEGPDSDEKLKDEL